ncbi:phage portal protein [Bacillus velezensis]|uniref:phage portal protein n=1 Tax=Bacillus velezensis TaxID=492670 RepID=UPI00083D22A7|nr:phage portal protein [Bacillus velezensis]ODB76064.1 portal protein [Bacillus velezensis]
MGFFNLLKKHDQPSDEYTVKKTYSIIRQGAQFPPDDSIERLAKYKRMRKLFEGKHRDVYERATDILKDSPQSKQLEKLYIAVNLADILVTKPADMLVGEPVHFESGLDDTSKEQTALNRYVEENDLNQLLHESAMSNGYRGDAWIKVRFGYRQDYSELISRGLGIPEEAKMESVVEHVNANCVFPEFSAGNVKQIKAVNIAQVEWVETEQTEIPFLNVERHIPGHIFYTRYRLYQNGVDVSGGAPISVFNIGEEVPTGREEDHEETFLPHIPVFHIPYKSIDDSYFGIGGLEKIETVFAAINDRLVQIDYILWKHSDPTAYGPDLETTNGAVQFGGKYIPVNKDDPTPGYMVWQAQLDAAFKQLDMLLSIVFQMSETPQWLFGTTMSGDNSGGTGTSHTDGAAIKARFMPILSKIKRIRAHYDKAIRDALWTCMLLEKAVGVIDVENAVYPRAIWSDGLPKNEKELAEIMQIRTGGKPTIDVRGAIKQQDDVDDEKADEIIRRIEEDEKTTSGFVDGSIFNKEEPEKSPSDEDKEEIAEEDDS